MNTRPPQHNPFLGVAILALFGKVRALSAALGKGSARYRIWVLIPCVLGFICLWTLGMATSFATGRCRSDQIPAEDRLPSCTTAIATGVVFSWPASENAKRAAVFLARGKIHAAMGLDLAARTDFRTALVLAAQGAPIILPEVMAREGVARLFAEMRATPERSPANLRWTEAVVGLACLEDPATAAANRFCQTDDRPLAPAP